jgi:hypothetical protein
METEAIIGFGVKLSRGDGASPEVFTEVAEIIDLTTPSMTKDQVEATHTNSPDGFREYIPGLKDGGEFTASMNYVPGNATQGNASGGLLNDFINDTASRNWRITFPGSPAMTWTFKGTPISYMINTPLDDRATIDVSFKVGGAPTIA